MGIGVVTIKSYGLLWFWELGYSVASNISIHEDLRAKIKYLPQLFSCFWIYNSVWILHWSCGACEVLCELLRYWKIEQTKNAPCYAFLSFPTNMTMEVSIYLRPKMPQHLSDHYHHKSLSPTRSESLILSSHQLRRISNITMTINTCISFPSQTLLLPQALHNEILQPLLLLLPRPIILLHLLSLLHLFPLLLRILHNRNRLLRSLVPVNILQHWFPL